MSREEYISSGILEAYALDQLSSSEVADVEKRIQEDPLLKVELQEIEKTLETIALETSISPPTNLKTKILKELEDDTKVVSLNPTTRILKFATAASIIVAIGSLLITSFFWNKWQSAEQELSLIRAENLEVAAELNKASNEIEGLQSEVAVAKNSDFQRIILNGTENAPESSAIVYWNKESNETYLSIFSLAELNQNQQFQLWAIIDGKPIDAGVFDSSSDLVKLKLISGASAFAVTIEPNGGSENPTLSAMQVYGEV